MRPAPISAVCLPQKVSQPGNMLADGHRAMPAVGAHVADVVAIDASGAGQGSSAQPDGVADAVPRTAADRAHPPSTSLPGGLVASGGNGPADVAGSNEGATPRKSRTGLWRGPRQMIRRLSWGVADQIISSLTNAFVSIYIARDLGAVQFGAFSLAYVTYSFALNASRGLATDPLMVRFSYADLPTWRRAVADSTGTAVIVGLVSGACVLVAAVILGGTTGLAFLALG